MLEMAQRQNMLLVDQKSSRAGNGPKITWAVNETKRHHRPKMAQRQHSPLMGQKPLCALDEPETPWDVNGLRDTIGTYGPKDVTSHTRVKSTNGLKSYWMAHVSAMG